MICKKLREMNEYPITPGQFLNKPAGQMARPDGGIEFFAEALFTMTNFIEAKDLPLCRQYGLKAIVVEDTMNGWHKRRWLKPQGPEQDTSELAYDQAEVERRAKNW
jgi:hypothetical protein